MRKSKFDWGVIIRPTEECVRRTQAVKREDYAISLGKTRDGSGLRLVREGTKSAESWSADYWELLPE